MNFSQLHEQLRMEVRRRIAREVLTVSLLALHSGLQQPHISNFLSSRRRLGLDSLDRVLDALGLGAADLLPALPAMPARLSSEGIPLVSQDVAINDDLIRIPSIQARIPLAILGALPPLRARQGPRHLPRERFVAILLDAAQTTHMEPRLLAGATVILDRHANTPAANPSNPRQSTPLQVDTSIYAVRLAGALHFCYLASGNGLLILRPHARLSPVFQLSIPPEASPSDLVVGRVCCIVQPL